MTATHTPGPWKISWYECKMNREDVEYAKKEGNLNAKVGDVLWRAPSSIGPCASEHSHWGGDLLTVEEADARLIAAAPDLLEAAKAMLACCYDLERNDETLAAVKATMYAIAKATGETKTVEHIPSRDCWCEPYQDTECENVWIHRDIKNEGH